MPFKRSKRGRSSKRRTSRKKGRAKSTRGKSRTNPAYRIGDKITFKKPARRYIVINSQDASSTRFCNVLNLTQIPDNYGSTSNNGINLRQRMYADIRGWKVNMEIINTLGGPIRFRYAVVGMKNGTLTAGPIVGDFYRGNGIDRSIAFSAVLSGMEMTGMKLNTDKFIILKEGFIELAQTQAPATGNFNTNSGRSYAQRDFWLPLNRRIYFKDNGSDVAENAKVYLVTYADQWGAAAGSGPVPSAYAITKKVVTYFHSS